MKKVSVLLAIILFVANVLPVSAQDMGVYSTNIAKLNSSLSQWDNYLQGSATTSYTGSGCYAVYQCTLQYKASTGVWTNASNTHVVRVHEPGSVKLITDNFYGLSVGTQYRYHVYAVVYNSSGNLVDADVVNSNVVTYRG